MTDESKFPSLDPQLEARIVAMVLGEASDFEREQLLRLIDQDSQVNSFYREMQQTHALMEQIGEGDREVPDDNWVLPDQQRNKLLSALEGSPQPDLSEPLTAYSADGEPMRRLVKYAIGIAASLLFFGLIGSVALYQAVDVRTGAMSPMKSIASGDEVVDSLAIDEFSLESHALAASQQSGLGKGVVIDRPNSSGSKQALDRIKQTINSPTNVSDFYLQDDVQYLPTPGPQAKYSPVVPKSQNEVNLYFAENSGSSISGESWEEPQIEPSRDDRFQRLGEPLDFDSDGDAASPTPRFGDMPDSADGAITKWRFDERAPARAGRIVLGGAVNSDAGRGGEGEQHFNDLFKNQPSRFQAPSGDNQPAQTSPDNEVYLDYAVVGGDTIVEDVERSLQQSGTPSESRQSGMTPNFAMGGTLGVQPPQSGATVTRGAISKRMSLREKASKEIAEVESKLSTIESDLGESLRQESLAEESMRRTSPKSELSSPTQPSPTMSFGYGASESAPAEKPLSLGRQSASAEKLDSVVTNGASPNSPLPNQQASNQLLFGQGIGGAPYGVPVPNEWGVAPNNGAFSSGMAFPSQQNGQSQQPTAETAKAGKQLSADDRMAGVAASGLEPNSLDLQAPNAAIALSDKALPGLADHPFEDQSQLEGFGRGYRTVESESRSVMLGVTPKIVIEQEEELPQVALGFTPLVSQTDRKRSYTDAFESVTIDETDAAEEAFSTFSLHVSDVSFKLAKSALAGGTWPEQSKIRIEEFVNAFDYGDPLPQNNKRVACRIEQAIHPSLQQRNLMRVSLRTAALGRSQSTPLHLTLLVDNSGSMERTDRKEILRRGLKLLSDQLTANDRVTLISFSRQPRLIADNLQGGQSDQLLRLLDNLPIQGGTNIESALELAFQKARQYRSSGAQSRVILLTDGAVNLGDANPSHLSDIVESMRIEDIAFDAAGISAEGLNDEVLETLTRKGDGRYYLLDDVASADDGFAKQIAGALRPSAKNVKVQIEFNPNRVGNYKLLGFEKHRLEKEDFRNDAVDAAELTAEEAGVALYQVQAKPDGDGEIGTVSVRFQDLETGQMVENRWTIPYQSAPARLQSADSSMRLAAAAAFFASKLKGEPLGETIQFSTLTELLQGLPTALGKQSNTKDLIEMITQASQLSSN
ncbi:von Willebrand factor type A domain-containing protein [Stieleria sp. JC731]|uniref:vWA domain-containing protein n=1 Tax=Pirellulaceae TaxID=2691357 RepID=UPI001E2E052C|nr:von Willebrand factor type A domain-containing protein [Stieleria sp. JC731]MCC9603560.1 von Willebrand factor type A domain-containing protein [Stieleria sp. JC731]